MSGKVWVDRGGDVDCIDQFHSSAHRDVSDHVPGDPPNSELFSPKSNRIDPPNPKPLGPKTLCRASTRLFQPFDEEPKVKAQSSKSVCLGAFKQEKGHDPDR